MDNCFGFIDGTVRGMARPSVGQRSCYNGHKRKHALKFQSVVTPDGMIVDLCGPFEGRRSDCFLLTQSEIEDRMIPKAQDHMGRALCIYGDGVYPLSAQICKPFVGSHLSDDQEAFNRAMSVQRVHVEYGFQRITSIWAFLDFPKNLKNGLQSVGKQYMVGALLVNCMACFYGTQTSQFYGTETPNIYNYL